MKIYSSNIIRQLSLFFEGWENTSMDKLSYPCPFSFCLLTKSIESHSITFEKINSTTEYVIVRINEFVYKIRIIT